MDVTAFAERLEGVAGGFFERVCQFIPTHATKFITLH